LKHIVGYSDFSHLQRDWCDTVRNLNGIHSLAYCWLEYLNCSGLLSFEQSFYQTETFSWERLHTE